MAGSSKLRSLCYVFPFTLNEKMKALYPLMKVKPSKVKVSLLTKLRQVAAPHWFTKVLGVNPPLVHQKLCTLP